MSERDVALANITRVARKLDHLRERVVFLGGSIVALLMTDPAAGDVRPTTDVDIAFKTGSISETYAMDEQLSALGFLHSRKPDAPTCRWNLDELEVDVMPIRTGANAYADRWTTPAIEHAETIQLDEDISIRRVTAPYFVAIKLETFCDRGSGDYLNSVDIDDIIQVVDARRELTDEMRESELELQTYVSEQFRTLLVTGTFLDSIPAHLLPDEASRARETLITDRMRQIAALARDSN